MTERRIVAVADTGASTSHTIKKTVSVPFMLMGILFCVCLITANLLEVKLFHLWGDINLTCGFLVFPISYIINDCIAEVWGYRKARLIIWMGFLMNFFVASLGGIACLLPPLEPGADTAFCQIFGFVPQVVFASLVAFVVGSMLNALVMSKMKLANRNDDHFKYHFSIRAIASTIVGETADSLVFFPLAFYIFPLVFSGEPAVTVNVLTWLMATQVVAKTLYEIIALPITIRVVRFMKRHEKTDVYDDGISYNIFRITDL